MNTQNKHHDLLIISDIGDVLIDNRFEIVTPINDKLAEFYAENKSTLILATDDPVHSALRAQRALRTYHAEPYIFSAMIHYQTYHMHKDNPDFWPHIFTDYKYDASHMLFLDDRPSNIETARNAGITTVLIGTDMNSNVQHIDEAYQNLKRKLRL